MATKSTAEKTAAASDADIEADVEDVIEGEAPEAATLSDDDIARQLTAESLTKDYVLASVAASIVPVAIFDIAAVVAIQMRMIQKLSQLYGKPFSDKMGRKVIYALAGGVLGYGAGYAVAASATKLIPGIGWMVGMVSLPVVAGASTYAVGRSIARHYEDGGSLMDFDASKMRAFYKEQFEKGKELAKRARDRTKSGAEAAAETVEETVAKAS
ncbi:YcjF family protein [Stappia sp. 28M-7]|uniref:YcjF family protein n=1 Tax=Stappia sp. 28M-7 TaxID=2762596 RepID=UPI00163D3A30|nr:DUF697 domain-containing protein [Stappia sp. 28M-7]MBC2858675.1 DUF697 domain-containing protein [Stappia sp. 28M-7]